MPSVREHLIFKALAALYEVVEASRRSAIQPSYTIRFCLAFLHSQGNGKRSVFDDFWRDMQDEYATSTDGGRYMRHSQLGIDLAGIIRDLGFNTAPEVMCCLGQPGLKGAAQEFWAGVQRQLDDGRPMPTPRFRRG